MRSGIPAILAFLLLASTAHSEQTASKKAADQFLNIYFQLSPNSQGLLEGGGNLDINWWRYLKSGAGYASVNSVVVTNEHNSNYTLSSTARIYTLDAIHIRPFLIQDILQSLFALSAAPDFLKLDAGIDLVISSIQESRYGYIDRTNTADFFLQNITLDNIKPMLNANISLRLGFFTIGGTLDYTLYVLSAKINNEIVDSLHPQKISNNRDEIGFERNFGGKASLDFDELGLIGFSFGYHEYTGVYYRADNGISYGYILMDYTGSCTLELGFLKNKLGLMDQIPVIGLTGVQHVSTTFDSTQSIQQSFSDLRFQMNLGIKF